MKFRQSISVLYQYLIGGTLFGAMFPVFAIIFDCLLLGYEINLQGIAILHAGNPIHYVVDTAPVVLGIAGYWLGLAHQRKNDVNKNLMEINQSLDAFIYKITHDMKSPASTIQGFVKLLKLEKQDEETKRLAIQGIDKSMAKWIGVFDELISLLQEERLGIKDKSLVSLDSIVSSTMLLLSNEIKAKEAQIHVNTPHKVYAAKDDMMSIVQNLLTNSLKYAHPERIPIVSVLSHKTRGIIKLEFEDNGIGIDLDKFKDTIFEKFGRTPKVDEIDGTGLGLFLVKQQVEFNDGQIEVESKVDEGTKFTITLPGSSKAR